MAGPLMVRPGGAVLMRRPTLVGGDVTQLGHGFNLGNLLKKGIGLLGNLTGVTGPKLQLPKGLLPQLTNPITSLGKPLGPVQVYLDFVRENFGWDQSRALLLLASPLAGFAAQAAEFGVPLAHHLFPQLQALWARARGGAGRRRRMNPLNLRALGRADRRLTSFARIASRYVRKSAPQRRVHAFKKRRR